MASLAGFVRSSRPLFSKLSQCRSRSLAIPKFAPIPPNRFISKSTSNKDGDVPVLDEPILAPPSHILKQPITPTKDWVTHGFSDEDEIEDLNEYHHAMFCSYSVVLVGIIMCWVYYPDYQELDWTQREAYIQIREREKAGLPYVDPNYVDPATIPLPSDEELEGVEIII
ncbi:unnamed protein product [Bemisia tabaci]|uniref:NADH dehydrogenase [ubiquinone] 1 beta subcomplex subunit 11, mitochondrial n=1 Tax=Bemisia tabaci TaxID=7038 RepID=A0A9P0A708_BEMTA|nr:PREDICTED: NADH dehydrogenase [ubiquinone] 1 beta subcomplex subunit 11, mitochondrial [Bemisia tabaci]CAH0385924.1 unnamed protein product [Bemisia tabaci]